MITVTFRGKRIAFTDAASYDSITFTSRDGISTPERSLSLFDDAGNRIATFYDWDTVDAGEQP